jgi:hypothetical protein
MSAACGSCATHLLLWLHIHRQLYKCDQFKLTVTKLCLSHADFELGKRYKYFILKTYVLWSAIIHATDSSARDNCKRGPTLT